MLPDEVLLEIFDFYVVEAMGYDEDIYLKMEAWQAARHWCTYVGVGEVLFLGHHVGSN